MHRPIRITATTAYGCSRVPSSDGGDNGGGGGGGGVDGGAVFLIIFFVGGFLYVAVGMAWKYKRYDARGWEMVPNREFWADLPHLIKDGLRFTYQAIQNRCQR